MNVSPLAVTHETCHELKCCVYTSLKCALSMFSLKVIVSNDKEVVQSEPKSSKRKFERTEIRNRPNG